MRQPRSAKTTAELKLRVKPGSRTSAVLGIMGDALKVSVSAPPEKGKANEEVVELLARALDIRRSAIRILHGLASRDKQVSIEGLSQEEVDRRLGLDRSR